MKSGFQFFLPGMTMKRDQPPHHSFNGTLPGARSMLDLHGQRMISLC